MKVEDLIRKNYPRALLLLTGLSLPFLIFHKSNEPFIGPYSIEFIIFILLPLVTILLITIFIYMELFSFNWLKFIFQSYFSKNSQTILLFGSIISVIIVYSLIPINYLGTLLLFLAVGFLLLLGERISGSINPILSGWVVVSFGLLLFGIEIGTILLTDNLMNNQNNLKQSDKVVYWGDDVTFQNLFQKSGTYIEAGGRLQPNLNVKMASPGISDGVLLMTNSIGFRNQKDFTSTPKSDVVRILSLGDSFSTGFGVDQNHFFGTKIQALLTEKIFPKRVEVLNVEISDPAYGAWYLQKYGENFHPDIVLFGLSTNDIMQSEQFFGPDKLFYIDPDERLVANTNFNHSRNSVDINCTFIYPKKGNKLYLNFQVFKEWRSRISQFKLLKVMARIVSSVYKSRFQINTFSFAQSYEQLDGHKRMIDGSNNFGLYYKTKTDVIENMYDSFFTLLSYMNRLTENRGAKFILFIHPHRYQVQSQDWLVFSKLWNFDNFDFDLRLRNKSVASFCEKQNISLIDPVEKFTDETRQLYLPNDVHYNNLGHYIAANEAADYIYLQIQ